MKGLKVSENCASNQFRFLIAFKTLKRHLLDGQFKYQNIQNIPYIIIIYHIISYIIYQNYIQSAEFCRLNAELYIQSAEFCRIATPTNANFRKFPKASESCASKQFAFPLLSSLMRIMPFRNLSFRNLVT